MTLPDLLTLAQRRYGRGASVRVTLTETDSGRTYVATASRSIATGSGAEECACEAATTEDAARDALAERLRGRA